MLKKQDPPYNSPPNPGLKIFSGQGNPVISTPRHQLEDIHIGGGLHFQNFQQQAAGQARVATAWRDACIFTFSPILTWHDSIDPLARAREILPLFFFFFFLRQQDHHELTAVIRGAKSRNCFPERS